MKYTAKWEGSLLLFLDDLLQRKRDWSNTLFSEGVAKPSSVAVFPFIKYSSVISLFLVFLAGSLSKVQAGPPQSQLQYSYSLASNLLYPGQTNPVTGINNNPLPTLKSDNLFVSDPKIQKTFLISRMIQSIEKSLKACEEKVAGELNSGHYQTIGTQLKEEVDRFRELAGRTVTASDAQVQKFIALTESLSINICKREPYSAGGRMCVNIVPESCPIPGLIVERGIPSGLTVTSGGAWNNRHFSSLVESGAVPQAKDFSADGCLKEFDCTLDLPEANQMISFHTATAFNSENQHYYLQFSMNSGLDMEKFQRKPLNLCIVLDISGSMRFHDSTNFTRLEWAKMSINKVLTSMNEDDLLSIVLFNDKVKVLVEPTPVTKANADVISLLAKGVYPLGTTNLYTGLQTGYEQIMKNFDQDRENRVILLSDAGTNTGETDPNTNLELVSRYAGENIGLTTIGIGDDFNQSLIDTISHSKGGNYLFAQSGKDMDTWFKQFDLLVTPVAYDLKASVTVPGYRLVRAFGIPAAEQEATTDLINISTLFFTSSDRGGAIFLEYEPVPEPAQDSTN